MATTQATRTMTRAERTARVHQLAAENHSNRAIARQLGMHHTTVGRILRTTPAPVRTTTEQPECTTPTTSENPRAPRLLHDLDPRTIQDLNCLMDSRTGALPEPIRRYLRAAADARRTSLRATAHRIATEDAPPTTGRRAGRAQVAP